MPIKGSRNLLLRRLREDERSRIEPHLVDEVFAFKQTLHEAGKPVRDVYFLESGVGSIVTELEDGDMVETGTVGNEGMIGLSAVLGDGDAAGRALCQIPGRGWRLDAHVIHEERERGSEWFTVLLRYANFVNAMTAQSAACNRAHDVGARMSRWLLMTRDRVDSDEFPLTQEFLGTMLGVARPTVNVAGATLQRAGFIKYTRGRITVLDRVGLESASCECYQRIRMAFERAMQVPAPRAKSATGR